jgi:hypothetical protein
MDHACVGQGAKRRARTDGVHMKAWFKRSKTRLKIWFLQLLLRVVQASWFQQGVLRPVVHITVRIAAYWLVWAFFFNRLPKHFESNPQIAQMMEQIRTLWHSRGEASSLKEKDTTLKTITWGTAGAGVVILTAIVIDHKFSPAIWIATLCFTLAVPFLIMFGMVYGLLATPKQVPPTLREGVILVSSLYIVHLIFYVGLAAFLWNFDPKVSAIFLIGSFLALRYYSWFIVKLPSSQPNTID